MPPQDNSLAGGRLARILDRIHDNFIWLLLATYGLATFFPDPGLVIRNLSLGSGTLHPADRAWGDQITAPMLLLALLLFCAAAVARWSRVADLIQRPGMLCLGLVAVWIVPGLFVGALGWVLPHLLDKSLTAGMLVGLAIVAAMPVANSSVAWTQNTDGNVALGLGLILLTIVLCPLATPQMLNLMGLALAGAETEQCRLLVTQFSGSFFIVWVILPALAGALFHYLLGPTRIARLRGVLRLTSALTLLTLNYANASLALPRVLADEGTTTLLVAGLLAIGLSGAGVVSAWGLSRLLDLSPSSRAALVFGLSMKHTGLALVLACEVEALRAEPRVILMIVVATLLQHVVAGIADWVLSRASG